MNKLLAVVVPALLVAVAPIAQAQSISAGWKAYRDQQKGVATPAPAAPADGPAEGQAPVAAPVPPPATQASAPAAAYAPAPRRKPSTNPGVFVGVQGGSGWVFEDVDQRAISVNAGYRWQAGDVSQVGVEVGAGRLRETEWKGIAIPEVKYTNIGANARFNFGRDSAWFGVSRLGYWHAKSDDLPGDDGSIDGFYAGLGVGVDITRNFNLQLMYTMFLYSSSRYYDDDYEVNRADLVNLGAELRF